MNDEHHVETRRLFEATPVDRNDICLHERHCSQIMSCFHRREDRFHTCHAFSSSVLECGNASLDTEQ